MYGGKAHMTGMEAPTEAWIHLHRLRSFSCCPHFLRCLVLGWPNPTHRQETVSQLLIFLWDLIPLEALLPLMMAPDHLYAHRICTMSSSQDFLILRSQHICPGPL